MAQKSTSLRTPLAKIRYLGSARSGTRHNAYMRITSLALLPLTIAFVVLMISLPGKDFNQARAYISHPIPSVLMLLYVGTAIFHMQLGMRSIIEDYVHGHRLKEWTLAANVLFCTGMGVTCLYALLRIGFA